MRFAIALLAFGSACILPAAASADPVYSQPYTTVNAFAAGVYGVTLYDNFTLSSAASITSVNWDGVFFNGIPAASFTIDFYADNSGTPGALLFANPVGSSNAADTGTKLFSYDIYSFNSSISPFVAAAGTEYWISIAGNSNSNFYWSTGSGGDGSFYRSGSGPIPYDLAFTLNTTNMSPSPTPEPSSLILLGTGLVGVAGMARRRLAAMRGSQS